MSARALAEYFKDQTAAVDDLGLPPPFEIALLHGAQRAIDDDEIDFVLADHFAETFNSAAAQQSARAWARNAGNLGANHIEPDRSG